MSFLPVSCSSYLKSSHLPWDICILLLPLLQSLYLWQNKGLMYQLVWVFQFFLLLPCFRRETRLFLFLYLGNFCRAERSCLRSKTLRTCFKILSSSQKWCWVFWRREMQREHLKDKVRAGKSQVLRRSGGWFIWRAVGTHALLPVELWDRQDFWGKGHWST